MHAMEAYGGMQIQLHTFLIWELREMVNMPGSSTKSIHVTGDSAGSRAGIDA